MDRETYTIAKAYSDAQLLEIAVLRRSGLSWEEVAKKFNKKYKTDKAAEAIRRAYRVYGNLFELPEQEADIKKIREVARTKKNNSRVLRENRKILEYLELQDDIIARIEETVKKLNKKPKVKIIKKKAAGKKKMTLEALLSDIHYGKLTQDFNLKECRRRLGKFVHALINEYEIHSKVFNVHRIIVALLGDIIESYTMHALESAKGCEFGNSQQVQVAIESLFEDVLVPIAQLGVNMDVVCVTGNHDRTELKRTMHNPGQENLTWIIYKTLEFLCKKAGYKHIKFHIPVGSYQLLKIYSDTVLYEHYHNAANDSKKALESLMLKRQSQTKEIISFMRGGHFHEYTMYGRGKIIVNASLCGKDSFSEELGFDTEASQTINYYVETKKRPTCFYRSFPVFLG